MTLLVNSDLTVAQSIDPKLSQIESAFLRWREIRESFGIPEELSMAEWMAELPQADQKDILMSMGPDLVSRLRHMWPFWARLKQYPPVGMWDVWVIDAGRGFGKTRTGAELVCEWARTPRTVIHLVGRTASDVRDVMVEGESGILAVSNPKFRPLYEPSRTRITWPNGSHALTFTSAQPEELRGPACHYIWADEPAVWDHQMDTWDNAMLGMRLGEHPQAVVTTTPKNTPLIIQLLRMAEDLDEQEGRLDSVILERRLTDRGDRPLDPPKLRVRVTSGSTYENYTNLAPTYITNVILKYKGTRFEQQEIYARLTPDSPEALWSRDKIERSRVSQNRIPSFVRIGIGVDPSGSTGENASECGIVMAAQGSDGHFYVLGDASKKDTPEGWARTTMEVYETGANAIVAEKNFGGLMVKSVLTTAAQNLGLSPLPLIELVQASVGKSIRAEPVSLLYDQDRIHHCGVLWELEDELCTWVPGGKMKSPNRLDALVWVITWLARLGPKEWVYGRDGGIF